MDKCVDTEYQNDSFKSPETCTIALKDNSNDCQKIKSEAAGKVPRPRKKIAWENRPVGRKDLGKAKVNFKTDKLLNEESKRVRKLSVLKSELVTTGRRSVQNNTKTIHRTVPDRIGNYINSNVRQEAKSSGPNPTANLLNDCSPKSGVDPINSSEISKDSSETKIIKANNECLIKNESAMLGNRVGPKSGTESIFVTNFDDRLGSTSVVNDASSRETLKLEAVCDSAAVNPEKFEKHTLAPGSVDNVKKDDARMIENEKTPIKVDPIRLPPDTPVKIKDHDSYYDHNKIRHVCDYCHKIFKSNGKLNSHVYSHTGERPFDCNNCGKAFSSKFKLVRHLLIHSEVRKFVCQICDRTFLRNDHLKNHYKIHDPQKKMYKCSKKDCDKEYSSLMSHKKHMAYHSVEDGDLKCLICSVKFETKDEILFHLKSHSGSRLFKTQSDKKFKCDLCGRLFLTKKDVTRHLVVHTGDRDFLCQFCPQRFGRKDHLVRHIKKSHLRDDVTVKREVIEKRETKSPKRKTASSTCRSKPEQRGEKQLQQQQQQQMLLKKQQQMMLLKKQQQMMIQKKEQQQQQAMPEKKEQQQQILIQKQEQQQQQILQTKEQQAMLQKEQQQQMLQKKEQQAMLQKKEQQAMLQKKEQQAMLQKKEQQQAMLQKKEQQAMLQKKELQQQQQQILQTKEQQAMLQKKEQQAMLQKKEQQQQAMLQKKEQQAILQKKEQQQAMLQKKEQQAMLQKKEQQQMLQKKEQQAMLQKKEQQAMLQKKEQQAMLQKKEQQAMLQKKEQQQMLQKKEQQQQQMLQKKQELILQKKQQEKLQEKVQELQEEVQEEMLEEVEEEEEEEVEVQEMVFEEPEEEEEVQELVFEEPEEEMLEEVEEEEVQEVVFEEPEEEIQDELEEEEEVQEVVFEEPEEEEEVQEVVFEEPEEEEEVQEVVFEEPEEEEEVQEVVFEELEEEMQEELQEELEEVLHVEDEEEEEDEAGDGETNQKTHIVITVKNPVQKKKWKSDSNKKSKPFQKDQSVPKKKQVPLSKNKNSTTQIFLQNIPKILIIPNSSIILLKNQGSSSKAKKADGGESGNASEKNTREKTTCDKSTGEDTDTVYDSPMYDNQTRSQYEDETASKSLPNTIDFNSLIDPNINLNYNCNMFQQPPQFANNFPFGIDNYGNLQSDVTAFDLQSENLNFDMITTSELLRRNDVTISPQEMNCSESLSQAELQRKIGVVKPIAKAIPDEIARELFGEGAETFTINENILNDFKVDDPIILDNDGGILNNMFGQTGVETTGNEFLRSLLMNDSPIVSPLPGFSQIFNHNAH